MQQIHAADPEPDLEADRPSRARRRGAGAAAPHSRTPQQRHHPQRLHRRPARLRTPAAAGRTTHGRRHCAPLPAAQWLATDLLLRGDNMEQPLPDLRFAVQSPAPSPTQPQRSPWPSSSSRHGSTSADPSRCSPMCASPGRAISSTTAAARCSSICFPSRTHSTSSPAPFRACRAMAPPTTTSPCRATGCSPS